MPGCPEMTGWPYTRPLAEREVTVLGCYGDLPSDRLFMSVGLLVRQVQQQRWPRLIRRRNMQSLTAVTFLSRLQLRHLVFSTPQPIAC